MSNVESTTTATRPTPSATPELPPNPQDLPIAPFADGFPMANAYELEAMGESIAKQGILVPVEIWQDEKGVWQKIDGRNRTKAAKSVNHRFRSTDFKVFVGTLAEAVARAEALDSHRRHLSKEQKEDRVKELIEKYQHLSSRKLALFCGVSHTTVARLRRDSAEEDTTYKPLERAWENASAAAQEQFARAFRIDLEEVLRGRL